MPAPSLLRVDDPGRLLEERLRSPEAYREQLSRLASKYRARGEVDFVLQDGASLVDLSFDSVRTSQVLAKAVASGSYRFAPPREARVCLAGKTRRIFRFQLTDRLVLGVLADALGELVRPLLSRAVYSYLRGRSAQEALSDFARFLRGHRNERPDPRQRGLHVVRCDVRSYGDSIPVADDSPLWPMLRRVLPNLTPERWALAEAAVRPTVALADGRSERLSRGVPTGSPVQPVICNLYLSPVDAALEGLGGFYARYGDDILFAHPDVAVAEEALSRLQRETFALGLELKSEKLARLHFNGAGRGGSAGPAWKGTTHLDYLGWRVSFDGTLGLKPAKARELLADVRDRIRHTAALLEGEEGDVARTLCGIVNRALDPWDPLAHRYAPLLRTAVTDRRQLRQLDHRVALAIAEAVSRRRGPRAFRDVPYRSLRALGLCSLVAARNGARKGGPTAVGPE